MKKCEQLYEGKAKKVFATEDPEYVIVSYKDDATAFDGLKKGTIAGKGVVNNKMSNYLMQLLEKQGVPTHYVEEISDRETIVRKVSIVPLEVIIRNISGQVFIDGQEIKESYINELTKRSGDVTFPLVVPKGKVFVMGDNRMHSTDSRSTDIGFIDTRYILGKATVRVLPFGDMNIYANFQQGEE